MVNTINTLTEKNKELVAKNEELKQKYESLHNQEEFIKKMIDRANGMRKGLRNKDNPWWNNPSVYNSMDNDFLEVVFGSSPSSSATRDLSEFTWGLISEICQLERMYVQADYFSNKSSKERDIYFKNSTDYYKEKIEKEVEIDELKEKLKEKEALIEHWKQRAERGEEDAEIHLKALTETSKEWNERKLEWWVGVFYKKLLDLNTVRNWQIENSLETIKVKDDDLEKASERIKVLENFVAWQEYVADKQFQELPVLPKKENKFKILARKAKSRVNEVKVAVKEKFNAYILQKSK